VNHQLCQFRLAPDFRLEATSSSMIASFLANRTMIVEVDGVKSPPRDVLSGVSQGSIPSPIFFAMFIDSLRLVIQHCQIQFYADDLRIYL
jgi:hypothetical protein